MLVLRSVDAIGYCTIQPSLVLSNHHCATLARPLCNFIVIAHHKGVNAFCCFKDSTRCESRK